MGLLEQADHQVTKGLSGVRSTFGLERLARKKSDGGRDPKILNWLLSCSLGDQLILASVEIMMALFFCLSCAIMSETITIVTLIFESVSLHLKHWSRILWVVMTCLLRQVVHGLNNGLNQAHIFRGG